MSEEKSSQLADPRWKDLYRLGSVSSLITAIAVLLAIVAFFIWPYKDEMVSMENVFTALQADRLGGLISLDLPMLLIVPINALVFLALYVALKGVNESYALIAIVLALISALLIIQCRPLVELTVISDKYAAAANVTEKMQALAAGEALRSYMKGTAWIMQTVFFMIAGLINCLLMLRTRFFSKATAWIGIFNSVVGLGFFLPVIGIFLLFINTIGTVPWCLLVARDFFRLKQIVSKPV